MAVMLAAGGKAIADIDTLRHQAELLGPVASPPTVWRTLGEATPAALKRVEQARARTRRHVWGSLPTLPVSNVAGADLGGTVVLDVDATLVTSLRKEQAKATFKGGFGFPRSACRQLRLQPCRGPHRRSQPGHRPSPDGISSPVAGSGRWGRRHPRAVGLADRPKPDLRPGVLGRFPDQEQRADQRHHHCPEAGVDACAHRRR
jgi:hypothetical protein